MAFSLIVYFCVLWYMLYFVAFTLYLWYFHTLFAFNFVFLIVICISELNWHLSDRNRQKVSESPIDSSNSVHVHLHSAPQCTLHNAHMLTQSTVAQCAVRTCTAHLHTCTVHLHTCTVRTQELNKTKQEIHGCTVESTYERRAVSNNPHNTWKKWNPFIDKKYILYLLGANRTQCALVNHEFFIILISVIFIYMYIFS